MGVGRGQVGGRELGGEEGGEIAARCKINKFILKKERKETPQRCQGRALHS